MKPPIYVYEPNDLDVFESLELAERYIEAIDVKNNEYEYFDSEGRKLEASVYLDDRGIEMCRILDSEKYEPEPHRLKSLILDMLISLGYDKNIVGFWMLDQLVAESLRFKNKY